MLNQDFYSYLTLSLRLAAKPRRGGGNMFRHQMETFAILLEYGYTDSVLLKAALIHDIVEDGARIGFSAFGEIENLDDDGPEVLKLVKEVSQHVKDEVKEPKSEFLLRIMLHGTQRAKILKLADRVSNISALPMAGDKRFISSYLQETKEYIVPYTERINPAMAIELKNRIKFIEKNIQL